MGVSGLNWTRTERKAFPIPIVLFLLQVAAVEVSLVQSCGDTRKCCAFEPTAVIYALLFFYMSKCNIKNPRNAATCFVLVSQVYVAFRYYFFFAELIPSSVLTSAAILVITWCTMKQLALRHNAALSEI